MDIATIVKKVKKNENARRLLSDIANGYRVFALHTTLYGWSTLVKHGLVTRIGAGQDRALLTELGQQVWKEVEGLGK